MNGYGFGDTIKIMISLIYTKLCWRPAKLVRLPFLARNRKNINLSEGFTCGFNCRLNPGKEGVINIGKNFVMGDQCQIEAMKEVTIGNDVLLASRIYIGDSSHGSYKGEDQSDPVLPPNARDIISSRIVIGNNVWIGNGVSILPGVTVCDGAVIGAGSVVTHDIPENTIAAGNPAKVIKKWNGKSWERYSDSNL